MVELGQEARALLDLARDDHSPSDADRARVRLALAQRLGAAAGLGAAAAAGLASSGYATATGAGTGVGGAGTAIGGGALSGAGASISGGAAAIGTTVATKLIATAILVGTAVGGGAATVHRLRRVPASVPAVAHVARDTARRPPPAVAAAGEAVAPRENPAAPTMPQPDWRPPVGKRPRPRTQAPVASDTPARTPESRRAAAGGVGETPGAMVAAPAQSERTAVPSPAVSPPTPPAERDGAVARVVAAPSGREQGHAGAAQPSTPELATEARLVREGVAALRAGRPARALALFDEHAAFYPRGVLAEERAAERVLALAELGRRAEALAAAADFFRAHPASPLATRLRMRLRALGVLSAAPGSDPAAAPSPR